MELKKCPFCGGDAEMRVYGFGAMQKYIVCCLKCEVEIRGYKFRKEAIEAWNRRVDNEHR